MISNNIFTSDIVSGQHFYSDKLIARTAQGLHIVDDGDNGMFLEDGGNVGIGTTSPQSKLEVLSSEVNQYAFMATRANGTKLGAIFQDNGSNGTFGAYDSSGDAKVWLNTNGDSYFMGGNAGIGTASPVSLLEVAGPTNPELRITDTDPNSAAAATLRAEDSSVLLGAYSDNSLYLVSNNSTKVTIQPDGKVGVGNTSPAYTFDVAGSGNFNNDLVVGGNLTVNGTTTTVNSTTLTVDDKNIELGSVDTPTNMSADGGGITLKGTTDKEFK